MYVRIVVRPLQYVCTKPGSWSISQELYYRAWDHDLEEAHLHQQGTDLHAQRLQTMPKAAVMVVSRHRGQLTLGKVFIIHPDVFSWQVGGDLVLVPGLSFQLQIMSTSHVTWLEAGVHHMPPTLYLVRICILRQDRRVALSVEHVHTLHSGRCMMPELGLVRESTWLRLGCDASPGTLQP